MRKRWGPDGTFDVRVPAGEDLVVTVLRRRPLSTAATARGQSRRDRRFPARSTAVPRGRIPTRRVGEGLGYATRTGRRVEAFATLRRGSVVVGTDRIDSNGDFAIEMTGDRLLSGGDVCQLVVEVPGYNAGEHVVEVVDDITSVPHRRRRLDSQNGGSERAFMVHAPMSVRCAAALPSPSTGTTNRYREKRCVSPCRETGSACTWVDTRRFGDRSTAVRAGPIPERPQPPAGKHAGARRAASTGRVRPSADLSHESGTILLAATGRTAGNLRRTGSIVQPTPATAGSASPVRGIGWAFGTVGSITVAPVLPASWHSPAVNSPSVSALTRSRPGANGRRRRSLGDASVYHTS